MNAADIDPTLVSAEPAPERLDDGFSPPVVHAHVEEPVDEPPEARIGPKSDF